MFNRLWRLMLITVFPFVALDAQDDHDVPPPLAYSEFSTDGLQYYVADFATGDVTTIQRINDSALENEFVGETVTPDEIMFQSPYDPAITVQFINETGKSMMGGGGYYTLYRIGPSGNGEFIADNATPVNPMNWSPNGRFFYFLEGRAGNG